MPDRSIEAVLEAHTEDLMAIDGVAGVGQGACDGAPCIVVYVSERTPAVGERIPEEIEGYAVRVEETGTFRTLPDG